MMFAGDLKKKLTSKTIFFIQTFDIEATLEEKTMVHVHLLV